MAFSKASGGEMPFGPERFEIDEDFSRALGEAVTGGNHGQ
jgi:hypothetical protein